MFMVGLRVKVCVWGWSFQRWQLPTAVGFVTADGLPRYMLLGASCCSLALAVIVRMILPLLGIFYLPYFPESPSWKFLEGSALSRDLHRAGDCCISSYFEMGFVVFYQPRVFQESFLPCFLRNASKCTWYSYFH